MTTVCKNLIQTVVSIFKFTCTASQFWVLKYCFLKEEKSVDVEDGIGGTRHRKTKSGSNISVCIFSHHFLY